MYLFSPFVKDTVLGREIKTKDTTLAPNTWTFLWSNIIVFVKRKLLGKEEQSRTTVARAPCLVSLYPPEETRTWAQRKEEGVLENVHGFSSTG